MPPQFSVRIIRTRAYFTASQPGLRHVVRVASATHFFNDVFERHTREMGPSRVPYTSSGPGGQYHPFGILGRLFRSFACYWLGVAAQLRSHLDSHLATALAACVAFGVGIFATNLKLT